jgi:hypothetical protein
LTERGTHPTIEKLRERRQRHAERSRLYRILFAAIGGLLIVGGLFLSVPGVPGPGLVVVAIGLGMLALEFDRAEHLLERILYRLDDARDASRPVQVALVTAAILLAAGAFVLTAVFFDVPFLPF